MILPMPDGSLLKACWKAPRDKALRPGDEMLSSRAGRKQSEASVVASRDGEAGQPDAKRAGPTSRDLLA
jgi:hypothetical protein